MQAVTDLLDAALGGKIYFEEFAEGMQKHGIESLSFDFITGQHRFYAKNNEVFDHHSLHEPRYAVSKTFNKDAVIAAISEFDRRNITAVQFHDALAKAGVSFARCFETSNRAIYMSSGGETYVEQW